MTKFILAAQSVDDGKPVYARIQFGQVAWGDLDFSPNKADFEFLHRSHVHATRLDANSALGWLVAAARSMPSHLVANPRLEIAP